MQAKLAHVRRLLDGGYELVDVQSDEGTLDATFRRHGQTTTIRFLPSEAEALLIEPARRGPLRASFRVPSNDPSTGRRSPAHPYGHAPRRARPD